MKVAEAAKQLNKSKEFIRAGLRHNKLPFGTAVKMSSKWTYYINKHQFNKYIGK